MFLTSFLARYHNYSPSSRTQLSSIPSQNQHFIPLNIIYLSKSKKTTSQQQSLHHPTTVDLFLSPHGRRRARAFSRPPLHI